MAITQSPTLMTSESPRVAAGRDSWASIFRTATSVLGSRPTMLGLVLLVVGQGDGDVLGAFNDMVVGEHIAILADDDPGAGPVECGALAVLGHIGRVGHLLKKPVEKILERPLRHIALGDAREGLESPPSPLSPL